MKSYLDFEGVYDKTKRYLVKNWSDEDFTQKFGAETTYNGDKVIESQPAYDLTIKAGAMKELGQFEAFTFTRHFVEREMLKEADKKESREEKERASMAINNPELRKPYEEKTIQEVDNTGSNSFMDELKKKIREDVLKENEAVKDLENKEKENKKENNPVDDSSKETVESKQEDANQEFSGILNK